MRLILVAIFLGMGAAIAQTVDTRVEVLPLYKIMEPCITMTLGIVVTGIVGWIGAAMKAKYNFEMDATMRAAIQQAAVNGASKAVAALEGPLGDRKIDVHSPLVADGAKWVVENVPAALAHFGYTPERIAGLVQAKLGAIQAAQGPTVPTAPAAGGAP